MTKARDSRITPGAQGNVVPFGQWAESTATTRAGMIKCSRELVAIAKDASDTMIEGWVEWGQGLRGLGSAWAAVVESSLEETGRLLAGDGGSPTRVQDGVCEMMNQVQRLLEGNRRLAQRQIESASAACQALSTMPARMLGTGSDRA